MYYVIAVLFHLFVYLDPARICVPVPEDNVSPHGLCVFYLNMRSVLRYDYGYRYA